ncbi:MAG: UvrD-helicase domain-containing protein [Lachnospiraceae bacterium]|nr:UvrD-helicase domain-containing protein [Lachnospiraceae bacterium]
MDKQEFLKKYTTHLNEQQVKAVQTVNGPVLLLAVPGSGKTTVLVHRLGYMIACCGIRPENILTLTYTVAATQDMSKRFEAIFGSALHDRLEFRTINGICAKVISRYAHMIGQTAFELVTDEGKLSHVLTDILKDKLSEYPTESEVKSYKTWITYCKNMRLAPEEIRGIGEAEDMPLLETYQEYNAYLRKNSLMDYDDQMVYGYNLLNKSPELLAFYRDQYRYICVDEAQDTSKIQHMIIKLLAGENGNLFMVGDEDQSIYGFRAAYPEALLHFEKDHPGAQVLVMDRNYRSNAKIVAAADAFIQHNEARHEKHMVPTRNAAADIRYIQLKKRSGQYAYLGKVAADCDTETAVLYRDNESALPLIDLLDRQQIPFRLKRSDMSFFTHRVVTDVVSILRLALDPYDTELFLRIYYKCQTYLRKPQAEEMCRISLEKHIPVPEAAEKLHSLNGMIKGKCRALMTNLMSMRNESPAKAIFRIEKPMGYLEYLERSRIDGGKLFILKQLAYAESTITSYLERLAYLQKRIGGRMREEDSSFILSTIHSSKGLEYDRVYLMDAFDGLFPSQVPTPGNATEEERKVFEEERRLFYVGMTRAKNELCIFRSEEESSRFVREITEKDENKEVREAAPAIRGLPYTNVHPSKLKSDFTLVIGERVVQRTYGVGTVEDVVCDNKGKAIRFTVKFEDDSERAYGFPAAFQNGMMWLENGEKVDISIEKQTVTPKTVSAKTIAARVKKREADTSRYSYWADRYPDAVVIKKEGYFWTCRGEPAVIVNRLLGYRLGGSPSNPVTGSPNLDALVAGLVRNGESYVVIVDGEVIDEG